MGVVRTRFTERPSVRHRSCRAAHAVGQPCREIPLQRWLLVAQRPSSVISQAGLLAAITRICPSNAWDQPDLAASAKPVAFSMPVYKSMQSLRTEIPCSSCGN